MKVSQNEFCTFIMYKHSLLIRIFTFTCIYIISGVTISLLVRSRINNIYDKYRTNIVDCMEHIRDGG